MGCPIIPEFIKYIKDGTEEETNKELSVTKVLYCPMRAFLLAKTDYTVQPEELYNMFRGSMGHLVLEKLKVEGCITETRFSRQYKGVLLTGKPDKIDVKNKILYDYKTIAGKISEDFSLKWGNARLHHQIQLNLYRWLLEGTFEIDKLVLVYIGSDSILKIPVKVRTPENKKLWKPMQDAFDRIEHLGKFWNLTYNQAVESKEIKKIKKEKGWICNYCFVKNLCDTIK